MLRVVIGEAASLCSPQAAARWLSPALLAQQPTGPRQASWLAGRIMLAWAIGTPALPPLGVSLNGKPCLAHDSGLAFNLSHSDGVVALALSDAGEVGCDVERIRARRRVQPLAQAIFSDEEQAMLSALPAEARLPAFWQCWTRREALIKQRAGTVWELLQTPQSVTASDTVFISDCRWRDLHIAVCASAPYVPLERYLEYLTPTSL
ncbi:4'-phosphopantetheinyl transferase AcpT [Cronobacter dublinensis]|uniref:4'-phosphopantetheinyl transferase AcpT n=1 Tax=Cronobacter dublinensis TaxID=413497 RepID=UPI003ADC20E5